MANVRKAKTDADTPAHPDVLGGNAQGQLIGIVERAERLQEEAGGIADDLKELFAEAKGNGFDVKILRKVIRLRKMDQAKRQEEEAILDLYESAINGTEQPFERAIQPGDTVNDEPEPEVDEPVIDEEAEPDEEE